MDFPWSVEYLHKSKKSHIKYVAGSKAYRPTCSKNDAFFFHTDGSSFLHNYLKFLKAVKDTWQTEAKYGEL